MLTEKEKQIKKNLQKKETMRNSIYYGVPTFGVFICTMYILMGLPMCVFLSLKSLAIFVDVESLGANKTIIIVFYFLFLSCLAIFFLWIRKKTYTNLKNFNFFMKNKFLRSLFFLITEDKRLDKKTLKIVQKSINAYPELKQDMLFDENKIISRESLHIVLLKTLNLINEEISDLNETNKDIIESYNKKDLLVQNGV